ncbi:MAG: protein-L-isoaspartate(D-aspartate) O-methyltransferase [Planctomycetota bacterium]|jgi:protein-L-isoaspartate(D-aspartate) O-methyltransferase
MYSDGNEDKFIEARRRMIDCDLKGRGITDPGVIKVMSEIRREEFVPSGYQTQAYADGPLPIGMGQTISQPFIVALMTQELRLNSYCEILEIGTGSGYQTAILSKLAKKIYTIDRIGQLSESAQAVLGRLCISNVEFYVGDGSCGWPEQRFFDRIIFTATAPTMPKPLVDQLGEGGLMIGPVGYGGVQELVVWEKKKEKTLKRTICEVRFVKLFGEYGFEQ